MFITHISSVTMGGGVPFSRELFSHGTLHGSHWHKSPCYLEVEKGQVMTTNGCVWGGGVADLQITGSERSKGGAMKGCRQ